MVTWLSSLRNRTNAFVLGSMTPLKTMFNATFDLKKNYVTEKRAHFPREFELFISTNKNQKKNAFHYPKKYLTMLYKKCFIDRFPPLYSRKGQ